MAGPNDVGVLRGIIGDGQSMNREEVKDRILGHKSTEKKDFLKMPIEKKHLAPNTNFNPTKALDHFTGKNRANNSNISIDYFTGHNKVQAVSPMTALKYFTGGTKISMDKFSHNDKITDEELKAGVKQAKTKITKTPKRTTVRITEKSIPIDAEREVATAQAKALIAEAQQRQVAAQSTFTPALDKTQQIVRLTGREWNLPTLFTSAEKSPRAGPGDILDLAKGVGGIVRGKQNLVVAPTRQKFQAEYVVPTTTGLKEFAAGIADNLAPNIASSNVLIGPFEPQGGTAQIRNAQRAYAAYTQTLHKRHKTSGNQALLNAKATEAERLKLEKLRGGIALKQQAVASGGFMGGQGGAAVLMGNVPRSTLNRFTELGGAFTRQSYGGYGPEVMAQRSVGQGLRADQPNKWGVLLGQDTGTAKIAQILGKRPDPMGESQAGKIQRLSVPMQTGEEAAAKIKRLSGM